MPTLARRHLALFIAAIPLLAPGTLASTPPAADAPSPLSRAITVGDFTLRVDLSNASPTPADRIELCITALGPLGLVADFPVTIEGLTGFRIVSTSDPTHSLAPSSPAPAQSSVCFTLEPFLAGPRTIPPISVQLTAADQRAPLFLSSEPIELVVRSLLDAPGEIPDAASFTDPIDFPPAASNRSLIFAASGAAVLLTIAIAAAAVIRRPRPAPTPDPLAEAIIRLDSLSRSPTSAPAEFYRTLSLALRSGAAAALNLPSPQLTTAELSDALAASGIDAPERARLAALLQRADLTLFAGDIPQSDRLAEDLDSARTFLNALSAHRAARPSPEARS